MSSDFRDRLRDAEAAVIAAEVDMLGRRVVGVLDDLRAIAAKVDALLPAPRHDDNGKAPETPPLASAGQPRPYVVPVPPIAPTGQPRGVYGSPAADNNARHY
jgi:hypothetical protein